MGAAGKPEPLKGPLPRAPHYDEYGYPLVAGEAIVRKCQFCGEVEFPFDEECEVRAKVEDAFAMLPSLLDGPRALAPEAVARLEGLVEPAPEQGRMQLTAAGRVVAEGRRKPHVG